MSKYFFVACSMIVMGATACNSATPSNARQDGAQVREAAATAAPTAQAATKASAPKPIAGYDWALRVDEEDRTRPAILAYEMANTDDQPLNFSCEEGGARIFAGISGGPDDLNAITLVSGDQTLKLGGKTEQTEMPDMPSFTSDEIAGTSAFLKAFSSNGWLRMTANGKTSTMAGTSVGAKAIAQFVEHCNRPYNPGV